MEEKTERVRQLVDWSAATWSGLAAGALFFILSLLFAPGFRDVLVAPTGSFSVVLFGLSLVVILLFATLYALCLAAIIHQWGMVISVLLGALFGMGVYAINVTLFSAMYDWFLAINSSALFIIHAIYGALAGAIYEYLEVESYVLIEPIDETNLDEAEVTNG